MAYGVRSLCDAFLLSYIFQSMCDFCCKNLWKKTMNLKMVTQDMIVDCWIIETSSLNIISIFKCVMFPFSLSQNNMQARSNNGKLQVEMIMELNLGILMFIKFIM
jgi:hypothetical protein